MQTWEEPLGLPEQDTGLHGWFVYFGTNFLLTPYVLLTLALTRWNYYVAVVWAHAWWSCVVYDWLHVDDCGFLCVMTSLVSGVTLWWDDCLVRRLFISDIYRFINKLWFCSDAWVSSDKNTSNEKRPGPTRKEIDWSRIWSLFVELGLHPISWCRLGCSGSKKSLTAGRPTNPHPASGR